jgi:hypothetical protein
MKKDDKSDKHVSWFIEVSFRDEILCGGWEGPSNIDFSMNVRICHSKAQRPKARGMVLIGVSHSLVVGEEKG